MSIRIRVCLSVCLIFCCLVTVPSAWATEDIPDFQVTVKPAFQTSGETYARFETPVYPIANAVNTVMVSVDIARSATANVKSYARFRRADTGNWTEYAPFESEFHHANLAPVNGYQLLFVVLDLQKGNTSVRQFAVQGKNLPDETLEFFLQKPVVFNAAKVWPKPAIVSRAEWNARPPKGEYATHAVQKIVLHHSWVPTASQYTGAGTIRGIQNYHMDDPTTGWSDIGYHFLIGPDGVIYQGRPETAVGAHAPPNRTMAGICIIGDYDPNRDQLNDKIEKSIIDLCSWLSSKYGVDPKVNYFGHRDFSSKTCPGDIIYDRLPYYRAEVLKNIGVGAVPPAEN